MKKFSLLILTMFLATISFAQDSPNKYLIKYLESNTSQPDYGVTFLNDNQFIYKSPNTEKINSDSQKLSQSNLFIATIGDEGEIVEKKQIEGIPTDKITKTGAAYSKDLKTVYFSAMKYRKKRKRNDREQLFKADVDADGNWTNMVKLPFSNSKYSFGEPALSNSGNKLYFTSDIPSSIGGADIFVVDINEDGSFGKVRNLGSVINTKGNEVTAYISKDNMLYFSSDGHPNRIGGLDVYVSDISENNKPTKPVHLDAPVNSVSDDFSFITNNDKRGYFASNRIQGQNNHDIYSFLIEEIIKDEKCVQEIVGTVKDKETEQAIADAEITLFDDDNNEIQQVKTDAEGAYKFTLDCNKTYTLKASDELYSTEEHIVNTANYLEAPTLEANKYLNKKTAEEIENAEILVAKADEVKDTETKEQDVVITNTNKDAVATISETSNTIDEQVFTSVDEEVSTTNIQTEDVIETTTKTSAAAEEDISIIEESEVVDNNTVEDDEATMSPVYFGFDKSNITAKAAKELGKIAKILSNNKNINIEVSSYTDSRGSSAYNLKLSERRAKASADYLVTLGVDRSRITTKGFGESKMVNKCFDGIECSEAAHEKNRRTEFAFLNPQVVIEESSYEPKSIKEPEATEEDSTLVESLEEEEIFDTIVEDTNDTHATKEELIDQGKNLTNVNNEESLTENLIRSPEESQLNLSDSESNEAKPTTLIESLAENEANENVENTTENPSIKTIDGFSVSQDNVSEEKADETLSFQNKEFSKENEVLKSNEPESQRDALNQLIAEADAERDLENNNTNSTTIDSSQKIDNSVPKELLAEINSQVVQPTTKPIDKSKTAVSEEALITISTVTIKAMQSKKGSYIETDKVKRINAFRVTFRIQENYLATKGYKDAFLVIQSPNGKVINEKGNFTLVNGDEQAYTDETTVYYNNQSLKVVLFVDKLIHKFTKGTHTLNVYIEGNLVGSDTLNLH